MSHKSPLMSPEMSIVVLLERVLHIAARNAAVYGAVRQRTAKMIVYQSSANIHTQSVFCGCKLISSSLKASSARLILTCFVFGTTLNVCDLSLSCPILVLQQVHSLAILLDTSAQPIQVGRFTQPYKRVPRLHMQPRLTLSAGCASQRCVT